MEEYLMKRFISVIQHNHYTVQLLKPVTQVDVTIPKDFELSKFIAQWLLQQSLNHEMDYISYPAFREI